MAIKPNEVPTKAEKIKQLFQAECAKWEDYIDQQLQISPIDHGQQVQVILPEHDIDDDRYTSIVESILNLYEDCGWIVEYQPYIKPQEHHRVVISFIFQKPFK